MNSHRTIERDPVLVRQFVGVAAFSRVRPPASRRVRQRHFLLVLFFELLHELGVESFHAGLGCSGEADGEALEAEQCGAEEHEGVLLRQGHCERHIYLI